MDSMDMFFGVIGLGMGAYILYATYIMKTTGKINQSLLLDKMTKPESCKDKDGYLKKVMPCMWTLGIVAVIYGAIMLINAKFGINQILSLGSIVVMLAVLIWYAVATMKAKKEFF